MKDKEKYWLPNGVSLKETTEHYTKESQITFVDEQYGEFTSTFKNIQRANASCHPKAIYDRQIKRVEALAQPAIREKAQNTMLEKYGVKNALESDIFLKKSQETLMKNYGATTPMESDVIKKRIKDNNIEKYGVDNVMKVSEYKLKLKKTFIDKYNVDNPMKNNEILERYYKAISEDDKWVSKGENEVKEYIKSLGLTPYGSYLGGKNPKQIDIKIEESNVCFEFNGCFWHSEANKQMYPSYHLEKTEIAENKGYKLLHIFDVEWETRNSQVKSFIKSVLGKNERYIYARDTEVKEVETKEVLEFLDKYHIIGKCKFIKAFGLYYENELVSVITIGTHHRGLKQFILNRYCGKENTTVVGGLSKLSKHAAKEYGTIYTWIDKRWSNGENWLKCGWQFDSVLPPDYFYYNKNNRKIVAKQKRKKDLVNTPEGMTEHQHALQDGLVRVYDCGKIKLSFKI